MDKHHGILYGTVVILVVLQVASFFQSVPKLLKRKLRLHKPQVP